MNLPFTLSDRIKNFLAECQARGLKVRYVKVSYDELKKLEREGHSRLGIGSIHLVRGNRWTS